MPLDVSDAHLAILHRMLVLYVPDARVVAFGSRVTGKAWRYSDLDLAIFGATDQALTKLRDACQASDLPFSVDVSDGAHLPPWLQAEVARTGVEVSAAAPVQGSDGPSGPSSGRP